MASYKGADTHKYAFIGRTGRVECLCGKAVALNKQKHVCPSIPPGQFPGYVVCKFCKKTVAPTNTANYTVPGTNITLCDEVACDPYCLGYAFDGQTQAPLPLAAIPLGWGGGAAVGPPAQAYPPPPAPAVAPPAHATGTVTATPHPLTFNSPPTMPVFRVKMADPVPVAKIISEEDREYRQAVLNERAKQAICAFNALGHSRSLPKPEVVATLMNDDPLLFMCDVCQETLIIKMETHANIGFRGSATVFRCREKN